MNETTEFLQRVSADPEAYARQSGLAEILERFDGKEVVLVVVNHGALQLALNEIASLLEAGVREILVTALDERSARTLQPLGVTVFTDPALMFGDDFAAFGTSLFNQITSVKFVPLTAALSLGVSVLFCDADVVFTRTPFAYFRDSPGDIIIQYGQGEILNFNDFLGGAPPEGKAGGALRYVCSGLFYARPTTTTVEVFRHALALLAEHYGDEYYDQDALNEALESASGHIDVRLADPRLFPNGGLIIRKSEARRACMESPIAVHANYLVGNRPKQRLFKQLHQWRSRPDRSISGALRTIRGET